MKRREEKSNKNNLTSFWYKITNISIPKKKKNQKRQNKSQESESINNNNKIIIPWP